MDELLIVLGVLTFFTLLWITAAIAGVLVIRQRLVQRNRVVPTEPSPAPFIWLWSPLAPARLHRRLQWVGATAMSATDGPARTHDPDPVSLEQIAAQLAYQAVVLDEAVVRSSRLPRPERRTEVRQLNRQVRAAERVAGRLAEHRRPVGIPSSGWTATTPDAALDQLHTHLDRLDSARSELDDIEWGALHPEDVLPAVDLPEGDRTLSHLPPPPAVTTGDRVPFPTDVTTVAETVHRP